MGAPSCVRIPLRTAALNILILILLGLILWRIWPSAIYALIGIWVALNILYVVWIWSRTRWAAKQYAKWLLLKDVGDWQDYLSRRQRETGRTVKYFDPVDLVDPIDFLSDIVLFGSLLAAPVVFIWKFLAPSKIHLWALFAPFVAFFGSVGLMALSQHLLQKEVEREKASTHKSPPPNQGMQ